MQIKKTFALEEGFEA